MPTHEPEPSEPCYEGEYIAEDYGYPGGAKVDFMYTEDDGFSYDPDAPGEVEWLSESVLNGTDVDWSDDAEKRAVGQAILSHHLKRAPTSDELDVFMSDVAPTKLEGGQEFSIGVSMLRDVGLEA